MPTQHFDVIVVGGGIAGSTLAGVLARAGLGVLVVEKEPHFRDRIRGEGTWPWGVAEARAVGLHDLLRAAGVVELQAVMRYENRAPAEIEKEPDPVDGALGVSFFHPQFQEAAFTWAAAQGATTLRPAKAVAFAANGQPALKVESNGQATEHAARLIVGADGKHSAVRRWTGGEGAADPEHHRMGGVLVSGASIDRDYDNYAWFDGEAVNWFAAGAEMTRLYLVMTAQRLRATGVDRSFAAIVDCAAAQMPEGALANVQQEGPIGYFSSSNTWASRIAGNHVVLIGDAAGAPDPTQGHGTPMIFRDVRALSELLLSETDWDAAIDEFACGRRRDFDVILAYDRWNNAFFEMTDEAARLREGHERALQHDPSLGGFGLLEIRGPAGLVADERARRAFFGEDLSA